MPLIEKIKTELPLYVFVAGSAFVIPFLYSKATIDALKLPRFTALAVCVLILSILAFYAPNRKIFLQHFSLWRRVIFLPLIGCLLFGALSLIQAINVTEALFEFLRVCLFFVVFVWAALIFSAYRNCGSILAKGLIISSLIISAIAIAQYYRAGFEFIPGDRYFIPASTMANKNLLSQALLLTLPFILFGFFSLSGFWLIFSSFSLVSALFTIGIVQSRAVWLALLAASIVTLVSGLLSTKRGRLTKPQKAHYKKRLWLTAFLMAMTFSAVPMLQSKTEKTTIRERLYSVTALSEGSAEERIVLWKKTSAMIQDHFWWGTGLGNWKILLPAYDLSNTRAEDGAVSFQRPHNDFLLVFAETGTFGFISFAAVFIVLLIYIFKLVANPPDMDCWLWTLLCLCGLTGFIVVSNFSFPQERIFHPLCIAIFSGLILAMYNRAFEVKKSLNYRPFYIFRIFSIIIATASIIVGSIRFQAETHALKASLARLANRWSDVVDEVDSAESIFYTLDPTGVPVVWNRGIAYFSRNEIDAACADFRRACQYHPFHLHALNNLATCYEMQGKHEQAIEFYRKALKISPRFEDTLLNLSVVYIKLEKYREAELVLGRCPPESENPRILQYKTIIENMK